MAHAGTPAVEVARFGMEEVAWMSKDGLARDAAATEAMVHELEALQALRPQAWKKRAPFQHGVRWHFWNPVTDEDLAWLYVTMTRSFTRSAMPMLHGKQLQEQYPLDVQRMEAAWRGRGKLRFTRDPHIALGIRAEDGEAAAAEAGMEGEAGAGVEAGAQQGTAADEAAAALRRLMPKAMMRPLEFVYAVTSLYYTLSPGVAGSLLSLLLGPDLRHKDYDACMAPLMHHAAIPVPAFCHEVLHMLWFSYVAQAPLVLQHPPAILRVTAPRNQRAEAPRAAGGGHVHSFPIARP